MMMERLGVRGEERGSREGNGGVGEGTRKEEGKRGDWERRKRK